MKDPTDLLVEDMEDGGMGSLLFASSTTKPRYGRTVSEAWFLDSDRVPVVVSLNLDQNDELFELDSWKVDFSPRRSLPAGPELLMDGPARMPDDFEGTQSSVP
jgi:hypothetical protein